MTECMEEPEVDGMARDDWCMSCYFFASERGQLYLGNRYINVMEL